MDLLSNVLSGSGDSPLAALVENRELLMILTTSVAVLIGYVVVLVWQRSAGQKSSKMAEPLKPLMVTTEPEPEPEVDDGKTKVKQTGTAEGFAKALAEEGVIKLNSDGCTGKGTGPGRFGGLFHNEQGTWINNGYYGRLETSTSLEAELWAVYKSLTIILQRGPL